MLLPNNMLPENSIYYTGYLVLSELKDKDALHMMTLYENVKKNNDITFDLYIFTLDWLYLSDITSMNSEGWVKLCS